MLVHYFAGADLGNFAHSIGEDYSHELSIFPSWAITKARRWWLSKENPKRRYKPLPGDLSERAEKEMAFVRIAQKNLNGRQASCANDTPSERLEPSAESKARVQAMVEKAGFGLRRVDKITG
ncbi:MAG: hypothetical protein COA84_15165 [Robiginitomaculum sp.]|nr:MAG: hypothetical protein COA84_15165 [Robiginitomaculum sp.]